MVFKKLNSTNAMDQEVVDSELYTTQLFGEYNLSCTRIGSNLACKAHKPILKIAVR